MTTELVADPVLDALLERIAPKDEDSNYKKIVIYGEPGAGKTIFSATAPKPLFYSTDTGFESVHNHPTLLANAERIPYGNIKFTQALVDKAKEGLLPFETLVIDTFTGVCDNALKELSIAKFKKDPSREAGQFVAIGKDYQENTETMKFLIANLTMAPMHVIYICHVEERKDETTGKIMTGPMLTPKIGVKLLADATMVGYMTEELDEKGVSTRKIQIAGGAGKLRVKNRIQGLPTLIENPTFDMLLEPKVYF